MAKFFQSKRGIIIKTISFFLHNSLLLLQASKRQIEWNIHATLNFKRKGRKRKRRERRPFFKFRKMKNEIKLTQIKNEIIKSFKMEITRQTKEEIYEIMREKTRVKSLFTWVPFTSVAASSEMQGTSLEDLSMITFEP